MSLDTAGRPTYQDVIDQIGSEFPKESFKFTNATLMDWIRQAEQEITDRLTITETYDLTVAVDDVEYDFGYFTVADATKIPMRFHKIFKIDRLEDERYVETKVVANDEFLNQRVRDYFITDLNYDRPAIASVFGSTMGKRVLRIWQAPDATKTLTIHGRVRVYPGHYASDAVTAAIQLSEEYTPLIREFVIAKAVRKDKQEYVMRIGEFNRLINSRIATTARPVNMKVSYQ
jgi:hypothetical protein